MLGASIFLPFLPMAPIQVLTNNLLYDFSQTTIPTDNVDEEYLAVPRKWDIGNIFKFMVFIGPISSIFDYATYGMMLYVFDAWNNPALFQTGWFVESLLTQTLIIHIIRTARIPFIESHASPALIATTVIICTIGMTLPFTWAGGVRFRTASLALLAAGRGHAGDIRCTHSSCESLVHSQVGTLRKPVVRDLLNVLRGNACQRSSIRRHTGTVGLSINSSAHPFCSLVRGLAGTSSELVSAFCLRRQFVDGSYATGERPTGPSLNRWHEGAF